MSESEVEGTESRTVAEVKASTKFLLDSFRAKMSDLVVCGPEIRQVLRFGVDPKAASLTAKKFFGTDTVDYLAVDGTDSIDQQLDLMVFYVGAFAYSGQVKFNSDSVSVGVPTPIDEGLSVSAAIPLSEEDAAVVFGQKSESGVEVDAERLPTAVMHLAEYYLAYRSVLTSPAVRVLLLDRTLAGDVAHLVWSTRDLVWNHSSVLLDFPTTHGKVAPFDLELTRMLLPDGGLSLPTPRSQLLKFAAIWSLFGKDELTAEQLIGSLGANPGRAERLRQDLTDLDGQFSAFATTSPTFKLKPHASSYWERVLGAALAVADHIFNPRGGHPLRTGSGEGTRWITADDLDFLTLVFIQAITRRAWAENLLPIGFIKDTNASELVKSVIPILHSSGLTVAGVPIPNFNSDKMLLQTNSVVNASQLPTPWRTIDIDAAFRTMAPVPDPGLRVSETRVNGAYGNVVYPERVYVKSYIQLWHSQSAPSVRSHVFSIDRPVYAAFDHWDELVVFNRDGGVDEKIRPVLHYSRESELTNLVMAMLTEMGQEVVPEALGHNYPLFLADKKAKAVLEENREAYLGAVKLEMAKSDLDQQVLFSRRFRDYRALIEGKRRS